MKVYKILALLGFCIGNLLGQSMALYFNINSKHNPTHNLKIDSLLKTHPKIHSISGYADFLGDSAYNVALSKQRAMGIWNRIKSHQSETPFFNFYGEKFSQPQENKHSKGEPRFRKVIIEYSSDSTNSPITVVEGIIELPLVEFVPGSHQVLENALISLNLAVSYLKKHPKIKIQIEGHVCCPDNFHPDGYDMDSGSWNLSLNRAKTVFEYFKAKGIDPNRMKTVGWGAQKPKIHPELTEDDRQRNRRVELRIVY